MHKKSLKNRENEVSKILMFNGIIFAYQPKWKGWKSNQPFPVNKNDGSNSRELKFK